jgi:hypothetical protein
MASPEDPFDDELDDDYVDAYDPYLLSEEFSEYEDDFDDEVEDFEDIDDSYVSFTSEDRYDERPTGLSPARRWLLIIVTLIIITALVATTILPGLLAARYNNARQMLPPPTVLPRV